MILKGAKKLVFQKEFPILKQGDNYQKIFQITQGNCKIVKDRETLGIIKTGEIFGEMSFLEGGAASADVIAVDVVELFVIEGYFIKRLLEVGRFRDTSCTNIF
jgi:CRP-like cAMP-binding protein